MLKHIPVCVALVIMTVIGARLGTLIAPYLLILSIIAICILVAKGIIKSRYYPMYVGVISLCLLWQTSLLGASVVGGDVHSEFYVSSLTMENGWDFTYPQQYNTSVVVTVLAPLLGKLVDLVWVYKIIFPLFLAGVTPIMYFVFKKQMGDYRAFWASMFFMFVPVMSIEIIGIAKTMVAELFFALTVFVIVFNFKYKYIWLPILTVLTLFCHYSVGIMLAFYLIGCIIFRLIGKIWKIRGKVGLLSLLITIVFTIGAGYIYFKSTVAGNMVLDIVMFNYHNQSNNITIEIPETTCVITTPLENNPQDVTMQNIIVGLDGQSSLVKSGIGLDFIQSPVWGKVFRIIQYTTQALIILGFIQLWRKRKELKFTTEYICLMLCGLLSLIVGIFVQIFSDLMNITRIYQLSLFFLAPLFVLGCEILFNKKWFMPSLLIAYFIFTSGAVFELSKSNSINIVDIPYSIPLSWQRTSIVAVSNQDDVNAAKWIASQRPQHIISGYGTSYLMVCYLGGTNRIFNSISRMPYSLDYQGNGLIFVSSWETEHNQTVAFVDIGLRELIPIPDDIKNLPIIYQSGNAIVRERK